jgi:hypothetical protein
VIFAKTCGKMKMNRRYSRKFSRKRNSAKIKKRQLHSTLCIYSVILNRRKWIIKYITVYQQQNYFSSGFLKNRTNLRFWFRNVSHNITVFLKILKECSTAGGKFLDDNFFHENLLLGLTTIFIRMQF